MSMVLRQIAPPVHYNSEESESPAAVQGQHNRIKSERGRKPEIIIIHKFEQMRVIGEEIEKKVSLLEDRRVSEVVKGGGMPEGDGRVFMGKRCSTAEGRSRRSCCCQPAERWCPLAQDAPPAELGEVTALGPMSAKPDYPLKGVVWPKLLAKVGLGENSEHFTCQSVQLLCQITTRMLVVLGLDLFGHRVSRNHRLRHAFSLTVPERIKQSGDDLRRPLYYCPERRAMLTKVHASGVLESRRVIHWQLYKPLNFRAGLMTKKGSYKLPQIISRRPVAACSAILLSATVFWPTRLCAQLYIFLDCFWRWFLIMSFLIFLSKTSQNGLGAHYEIKKLSKFALAHATALNGNTAGYTDLLIPPAYGRAIFLLHHHEWVTAACTATYNSFMWTAMRDGIIIAVCVYNCHLSIMVMHEITRFCSGEHSGPSKAPIQSIIKHGALC
ncbi:hypothetical protein VP01_4458g1 [Puccinia sorghi]|uniref:Uncharacterized protein n=1 Tax=Puccinia sorghi TaxID=27349 RepID=A0A0L6URD2_9BASI|nr:hypothetical protein VP01_4458g1 [Puccinia sorghi]